MMDKLKTLMTVTVVFFFAVIFRVDAGAQAAEYPDVYGYFAEQAEASGAADLPEFLDENSREYLESVGCDGADIDSIMSFSLSSVFEMLADMLQANISSPLKGCMTACGAVMLVSVCSAFFPDDEKTKGVMNLVCGCFVMISVFVSAAESVKTGVSAMKLCWNRFVSDSHISFYENEIAPLREITPDVPITTNFMKLYDGIDYQDFAKHLDLVSWDNYPQWHEGDDVSLGADVGFDHDLFRGFLKKPFLMMESSPSTIKRVDKYKRPGFGNLVALQAVAHGSESAQYFQWRRGRGAAEQFHGSVVDHNDRDDTLVFKEVTKTGTTLANINEMLSTNVKSKIALLYEYDIFWILNKIDGYNRFDKKYKPTVLNHYRQFWNMGKNVDIIGRGDDLSGYDLVILPMCFMVEEAFVEKVKEYVAKGGTVVATYMTAVSDENDLCYLGGAPAKDLKEVFGLEVEQTDGLYADDRNYVEYNGKTYEAKDYCEVVNLKGGKKLAEYKEDYYKGCPAVVENSYGKGKAYYIAFRDNGEFLKDFYDEISKDIKPEFDGELKYGITAHSRENYVILENFNNYDEELVCKKDYINIETNEKFDGKIKAYETLFLK